MRTHVALILLPLLASITALLAACSGSGARPAEIHFDVERSADADGAVARRLQFYVHDVELLDQGGKAHPFMFTPAAPWQAEQVVLVDLAGDASTPRNATIRGTVGGDAATVYSGIRFTVGVPFELNHANPLTATAPLDRSDLFWTWQSGYKFLRVDLAEQEREWSFHLGSTGCSSASALRPPAKPCAQPNRMRVEIRGGDPLQKAVRLRLDTLVAAMHAADFAICTGNYAHDPACTDAYASTGLQLDSGACADERCAQKLWALEP